MSAILTMTMEQLPLEGVEPLRRVRDVPHGAPPASIIRRAIGRAVAMLHHLDRIDPALSRPWRKLLVKDAGCAPLSQAERYRLGNLFRAQIFQRQALKMWWIPSERHITSRRTYENKESRRTLPVDAIYIGSYEAPVHESSFLDDLEFLLERIRAGCLIEGEPQ